MKVKLLLIRPWDVRRGISRLLTVSIDGDWLRLRRVIKGFAFSCLRVRVSLVPLLVIISLGALLTFRVLILVVRVVRAVMFRLFLLTVVGGGDVFVIATLLVVVLVLILAVILGLGFRVAVVPPVAVVIIRGLIRVVVVTTAAELSGLGHIFVGLWLRLNGTVAAVLGPPGLLVALIVLTILRGRRDVEALGVITTLDLIGVLLRRLILGTRIIGGLVAALLELVVISRLGVVAPVRPVGDIILIGARVV
jgi:hypothetical protein